MGTDPKSGLNAREDSLSADGQESKPRPRMREVKSRFMLPQKTPAHSATRNPTRVTPDIPKTKPPPALRGVPSRFNRTKKGPPPSSRQTDVGSSRHPLVALEPQPQPLHEQVHAGAAEKNAASAELTHSQSSDQNQFGSTARARRSNSAPISVAGESLVGSGPGKRVESDAAPCGLARVLRQHESPMPFGLPPPKANINVKSRPSNVTPTQRRAVFNRATPIGTLPKERDTHQTPVVSAEDAVRPEPALHSNGGTANATQTPSSFAEMEHPYSPAEGSGENASETDAAPLPAAKSAPAAGLTKDSLVRTHARVSSAPWKKSAAPTGVEHVRGPESRELSLLRARLLQLRYLNAALTKALQSQQDHHNSCILRVQMALVEKEDALAMQRGDLRQHEYLDRLAAILDAMVSTHPCTLRVGPMVQSL
eukprot:scaffold693_cov399-Prasinococcus_capsulatus_cf.AAC.11